MMGFINEFLQWKKAEEIGKDYVLVKLSEELGSYWWQLLQKVELNTKETEGSLCYR